MSKKLEGLTITADTAVVEMDELQGIISEGQTKGFLLTDVLVAAVEEAELSSQQRQDLFSYLEEHGIDVIGSSDTVAELTPQSHDQDGHDSSPSSSAAGEGGAGEKHEQIQNLQAHLEELKRPALDLSSEPSLDSLRLYLHTIGRVPLLSAAEEVSLAKRIERGEIAAKQHMVEANLRLVVSIAKG
jgi:RNA polymerase primary sigma factor